MIMRSCSFIFVGILFLTFVTIAPGQPNRRGHRPQQKLVSDPSSPGTITFTATSGDRKASGIFARWKYTRVEIPENDLTQGVVEMEIDLASTATPKQGMTDHLKSDSYFDIATRPKALVRIENATPLEGEERGYRAKATVVIGRARGEFPVRFFTAPQDSLHVRGEAYISRTRLRVGSSPDPNEGRSVDDVVHITIDAKLPAGNES